MADQTPIFKLSTFIYKREEFSPEEFAEYMTKTFAPKVEAMMKRNGILQFNITLTPEVYRQANREYIKNGMKNPEWTVHDYDAVLSYWVRNPMDMAKFREDPEFESRMEETLRVVCSKSKGHLSLGHDTVVFTTDAIPKPLF